MGTQRFEVKVPDATLADLRERLARTRFPDEPEGAGWDYGTSVGYLRELVGYWRERFDWRQQEQALNRFTQLRVGAEGERVHVIHERSPDDGAMPLLLLHGWPDSAWRMSKLVPRLTSAFHVVVPSLPGFGFSDTPRRRGFTTSDVADRLAETMRQLGYRRYGVHGGDWGSTIGEELARRHGDAVLGLHLTDIPFGHLFSTDPAQLTAAERTFLERGKALPFTEAAYAILQATKPQSLAPALNDSPAGLAAWIVEKLRAWSDCDGDVERRFTKDEILTNVTLYWVTQTIGSSMRYYHEAQHRREHPTGRVETPTGAAIFPKDILPPPREFGERHFAIRRWTEMPRGGHFAALEEPELLAGELREFFGPLS